MHALQTALGNHALCEVRAYRHMPHSDRRAACAAHADERILCTAVIMAAHSLRRVLTIAQRARCLPISVSCLLTIAHCLCRLHAHCLRRVPTIAQRARCLPISVSCLLTIAHCLCRLHAHCLCRLHSHCLRRMLIAAAHQVRRALGNLQWHRAVMGAELMRRFHGLYDKPEPAAHDHVAARQKTYRRTI